MNGLSYQDLPKKQKPHLKIKMRKVLLKFLIFVPLLQLHKHECLGSTISVSIDTLPSNTSSVKTCMVHAVITILDNWKLEGGCTDSSKAKVRFT